MSSESAVKKDIQKLQRAIIDGLEDVKGQDIQVFDTTALSPLFERVIVASGTSNRQTKALAASVRDAVREAGFSKPRTEGEENGEWIIVDCGPAVAHIMQPAIRSYYHLEEIWGEKPVRLKLGAPKPGPAVASEDGQAGKARSAAGGRSAAGKAPARKAAAKTGARPAGRAAPKPAGKTAAAPPGAKKTVAKAPAKTAAKTPVKSAARKAAAKPVKLVVGQPAAKKKAPAAKKSAPRKTTSRGA